MARFVLIKNNVSEKEVMFDTYLSRYRRLAMGFMNAIRLKRYFLKHITLTQTVESYHPRILNNFENQLRRRYGELIFFWTVEVQEERLEKYGDAVLHWHLIVGFPWGHRWSREDIESIQGYWKYGNPTNSVDIKPLERLRSLSYLMKYVTKALNVDVGFKLRRIGSSRLAGWLRQSWNKLQAAQEFFTAHGSCGSKFYWDYKGAYINAVDIDAVSLLKDTGHWKGGLMRKRYVYKHPPSMWSKVWTGGLVELEDLTF